jgi:CopG family nickel-responsive transcriptional regulator
MSDLVRFGVAMDRALLTDFDHRIAQKGYENRSEALRDLVRADLTKAAWDGGAPVAGTLTIVYSQKHADHVARLVLEAPRSEPAVDATEVAAAPLAHDPLDSPIVSALRVAIDATRTLEVLVLRGRAGALTDLAGRIGGARGVLSAELSIACALLPSARRLDPVRTGDGAGDDDDA